jgi:hypothetical protein
MRVLRRPEARSGGVILRCSAAANPRPAHPRHSLRRRRAETAAAKRFSSSSPSSPTSFPPPSSHRIAIVGAGPAGLYTAEALANAAQERKAQHKARQETDSAPTKPVEIDVLDRLCAPFGLVRSGVAPDHPEIKAVTGKWTTLLAQGRASSDEEESDSAGNVLKVKRCSRFRQLCVRPNQEYHWCDHRITMGYDPAGRGEVTIVIERSGPRVKAATK